MSRFQLHALVLIVLCGLALAGTQAVAPARQARVSTDFSHIPLAFAGWSIYADTGLGEETERLLPSSSLLGRTYEHSDYPVSSELAIVYGVDLGNFHQPEICLEGQGLRSQSKRMIRIKDNETGSPFAAMSLIMDSEYGRRAFIYWFMSGGTTSTSLGNYKTKVLVDRLMLREVNPSAMVRLSAAVTDDDEAAEKQLIDFAEAVLPYLKEEFAQSESRPSAR